MKARQDASGAVQLNLSWELFVLALAVLSVLNLLLFLVIRSEQVAEVVVTIDIAVTLVFIADFVTRLVVAQNRSRYMIHGFGWLDLIACTPALRIIRFVRVATVGRRIRAAGGLDDAVEQLLANRARIILLTVLLLTVVVVEFGSMAMLAIEGNAPNGNIKTSSDALWYLVVTISTIGYGDLYPTTNLGRLVGTVVLIMGIALFSTLTGYLAHFFYGERRPLIEKHQQKRAAKAAATEAVPQEKID